jgi:two-component system, NtrC family, sensor kinase
LRRNIAEIVEVIKGYQGVEAEHAAEQLAALHARAERIGLEESISELDDIIASIAAGSSRTAEIVRGLRNFSRLDEDDLKDADINDGLRSTLTVLGPQYRDKVSFNLELGDIPKVECFPGKVNQVFMNIMTNAVQATLARADLSKREVSIRTSYADNSVSIRIADNGVGMSDAVKARVFEPFFTTKGVGEGTGLGMAIVYGIINDHGGSIAIDSMPGAGTEFTITLPLRQERRMQKRA